MFLKSISDRPYIHSSSVSVIDHIDDRSLSLVDFGIFEIIQKCCFTLNYYPWKWYPTQLLIFLLNKYQCKFKFDYIFLENKSNYDITTKKKRMVQKDKNSCVWECMKACLGIFGDVTLPKNRWITEME